MLSRYHLVFLPIYLLIILQCAFTSNKSSDNTEDSAEKTLVIEIDRKQLENDKKMNKLIRMNDVIHLNIGGEILVTTRDSLTAVSTSTLAKLFNGRWEEKMPHDVDTNIFLDFNPALFRHLLEQLRQAKRNPSSLHFTPPQSSSSSDVRSFNRMLKILGLHPISSSSNEMVVMNVGGDRIITRQKTLNSSQSTALIVHPTKTKSAHFLDADPWLFRHLLGQLREQEIRKVLYFHAPSSDKLESMNRMLKHLRLNITSIPPFPARWQKNATTVVGSHGQGNGTHQLHWPYSLFIDEDQILFIADWGNNRIAAWKPGTMTREVWAGDNGQGHRLDQLNRPTDVIVDRKTDSLIICDSKNRRVMRWPRRSSSLRQPEIILDKIHCFGLTMDDEGFLYVSDVERHEVKRYDSSGDMNGTVVAGGHGEGANLNQLNWPTYLFFDAQSNLYISDSFNHRVMKWIKGETEGIIVAGGNGKGSNLTHLSYPRGLWVDGLGHIYVADWANHRVMRWEKGTKQGTVIADGNERGTEANQFSYPIGLSFDLHGHLYVVDWGNNRVQRFSLVIE